MRYLILECHPSYAVALDEAGRFIKVANLGYEVGQTVERVICMRTAPSASRTGRVATLTLAAAACLCLLFSGVYQLYFAAFGTVRMQINPDIVMTVSRMDRVVALDAHNADGQALIAAYDYSGKSKTRVSDELVDRAIAMGYLSEGDTIAISVDSPSDGWTQQAQQDVQSAVTAHLEGRMSVTVTVVSAQDIATTPAPPPAVTIDVPPQPTPLPTPRPTSPPLETPDDIDDDWDDDDDDGGDGIDDDRDDDGDDDTDDDRDDDGDDGTDDDRDDDGDDDTDDDRDGDDDDD